MAFESGAFFQTLAAASGEDEALRAELRQAFRDSLAHRIDLLARARCDANWLTSAQRIKGLAASFHVERLIALADEAVTSAPGDPVVLRRLNAFLDDFDQAQPPRI